MTWQVPMLELCAPTVQRGINFNEVKQKSLGLSKNGDTQKWRLP